MTVFAVTYVYLKIDLNVYVPAGNVIPRQLLFTSC